MTTLNIKSTHKTLKEAVLASGMNLSYNEPEAMRYIAQTEKNVEHAFVTEENEVYYIFVCDIRVLNKFSPFIHCIDDSPFVPVTVLKDMIIIDDNFRLTKNRENRKRIAAKGVLVTS